MRPQRTPAASKIDASKYEVVVLPLVPVMPTSVSSSLGCRSNAAARMASACRASATWIQGTLHVCRRRRFRHDSDCAARDRVERKRSAVGVSAAKGDEQGARDNLSRVADYARHIETRGVTDVRLHIGGSRATRA